MRSAAIAAVAALALSLGVVGPVVAAPCPGDSVASGTVCMDKYEASLWNVPPDQRRLIRRIQEGTVSLADLTAAGALQLGLVNGDLGANGCPITGNGCVNVYAVSIAGVTPARFVTWFQAAAAARNSLKRLPTNQEWQVAAFGTPDGAPCNVGPGGSIADTGSAEGCVSDVGAFDMVGNAAELVADWGDLADFAECTTWSNDFGNDRSCVGGPGGGNSSHPGVVFRGGFWDAGSLAGVFTVLATLSPADSTGSNGFRCVR